MEINSDACKTTWSYNLPVIAENMMENEEDKAMPGEILYEPLDLLDLKREQRRLAKLLDSHDVQPPTPLKVKRTPIPNQAYVMKIRKHLDPLNMTTAGVEDTPIAPPPSSMGMSEETIRRGFNYVKDRNEELFLSHEGRPVNGKIPQRRLLGKLPNRKKGTRLSRSLDDRKLKQERNYTDDDFGYKTFSQQMRKTLENNATKNIKTASEAVEAHKEKKRNEYDIRIPNPDDSFFRESPEKSHHTTKDVGDESEDDSSPNFLNRKARPKHRRRKFVEEENDDPVAFNYSHGDNPVGDDFMDLLPKYDTGQNPLNRKTMSRDNSNMDGLIRVTSFMSDRSDSDKVTSQCKECGDFYRGVNGTRFPTPFICDNCRKRLGIRKRESTHGKSGSDSNSNNRSRSESFVRSGTFTRENRDDKERSRSASPTGRGENIKDNPENDPSTFLIELDRKLNDGLFDYDKTVPSLDTVSQRLFGMGDDDDDDYDDANVRDESLAFPPKIPTLPKKFHIKPRRDQYKEAYLKALSAVRGATLPREPWMLGTGTSRSFVFSYFQAWPYKKRKTEEETKDVLKKPNKKMTPMKMIFGKVKPDDYLPGGPKNPLPYGQTLPKLVKEKSHKTKKAKPKSTKKVKFKE